jgi:choline kinase/phosphatidylglycerophosphate synthase
VVLAAGRAKRLGEVTGGHSKLLLRVGGLTLIERAVRMLLTSGLERVVVVVGFEGEAVAAAAARVDPDRVHIVPAERWPEGNGQSLAAAEPSLSGERRFVVLCGDIVFSSGALSDLVSSNEPAVLIDPSPGADAWAAGTRVRVQGGRATAFSTDLPDPAIDCGAFVFEPDIFEFQREAAAGDDHTLTGAFGRLAAARSMKAVPLPEGALWRDIDTAKDLRDSRGMLRRFLIKASDAPIFRYLYRPVSTRVTMALAPLRIPPDVITYLACLLGLTAACALAWEQGLLAGLLIQANTVLDGVDGETARLHFRSSPRGGVLDAVVDRIVDGSLVAGVGVWLWHPFHPSLEFKAAILSTSAYGWGFIAYLFQARMSRFEVSGAERPLVLLLGGRDSRLLILSIGSMIYQPGAAVAVGWALYLSSVFRRLFLRRRRSGTEPTVLASPHGVGEPADRDLHEVR